MPIDLPPVPELPEALATISDDGLLTRNFPASIDGEYMRAWAGETVTLEVEAAEPASRMVLTTNLGIEPDTYKWHDIPFERVGVHEHRLQLTLDKPGAYQFRLKIQLEGDDAWYWDRIGFGRLLVDPAWQRNLRIYTLVPTVSGTVKDWIALLPGIAEMGFNSIHLLPLTAMDFSESPYCAKHLFELDEHYLDPDDPRDGITQFGDFVDRAAELGLRLCMDLVLNHVGPNSDLALHAPDWLQTDPSEADGFRRAGWSDGTHWHSWRDLCLVQYDHPDEESREHLWDYMTAYARFWSAFAAHTGGMIRLDNLHSGHEGVVRHILEQLRVDFPDLGILAELFTDWQNMRRLVWTYRLGLLLATPWEHRFLPQLRSYLDFIHSQSPGVHFHFPITSHDSGSPAQEFGHPDSTLPRYAVAALCGCGYTGMVQGVEYGVPEKVEFIGRNKVQDFDSEKDFRDFIAAINRVMDRYPHFQFGGNLSFVDHGHEAVLAALREPPPGHSDYLLVIANFDIGRGHRMNLRLADLLPGGAEIGVKNLLKGEGKEAPTHALDIHLQPCEVRVYSLMPQMP